MPLQPAYAPEDGTNQRADFAAERQAIHLASASLRSARKNVLLKCVPRLEAILGSNHFVPLSF